MKAQHNQAGNTSTTQLERDVTVACAILLWCLEDPPAQGMKRGHHYFTFFEGLSVVNTTLHYTTLWHAASHSTPIAATHSVNVVVGEPKRGKARDFVGALVPVFSQGPPR